MIIKDNKKYHGATVHIDTENMEWLKNDAKKEKHSRPYKTHLEYIIYKYIQEEKLKGDIHGSK